MTRPNVQSSRSVNVAQRRHVGSFRQDWPDRTVICVADAGDTWSAYLRRMLDRPGWSTVRLAREAGLHRATISEWLNKGAGPITIRSVYLVADALGVDRAEALQAAGDIELKQDVEVDLIRASDRSDEEKEAMIRMLMDRREQERARRVADIEWMLGRRGESAS